MKQLLLLSLFSLLGVTSTMAGFSENKLESAKKSAARSGKGIAFVFYQNYYDPRCPRCIADVNSRNNAIGKALSRPDVVVLEIKFGDKDTDKLPACVPRTGELPRIVVTDAECQNVTASLNGAPDRATARAFKAKLKSLKQPIKPRREL